MASRRYCISFLDLRDLGLERGKPFCKFGLGEFVPPLHQIAFGLLQRRLPLSEFLLECDALFIKKLANLGGT